MDIPGAYFHVYNKGIEDRLIFADQEDYEVFLKYIREYLTSPQDRTVMKTRFVIDGHSYEGVPHLPKNYYNEVELVAYSLNPDHFHLLLKESVPGSVGKFMRSLGTRYAIYYNHKYKHIGGLFQSTFQSRFIPTTNLLKLLTYYLHHRGEQTSLLAYTTDEEVVYPSVDATLESFGMNRLQYAEYVSNGALQKEEEDLLQSVLISCRVDHLAKKNPPKVPASDNVRTSKVFLTFALFGFLFLTGISSRNILVQRKAINLSPIAVSTVAPTITPITEPLVTYDPSDPSVLSENDTPVPLTRVQVRIVGTAKRVNIRSNPVANAPIITKAYDGDIFEAIEKVDNWYAVKLPDGAIGYILSANVIVLDN